MSCLRVTGPVGVSTTAVVTHCSSARVLGVSTYMCVCVPGSGHVAFQHICLHACVRARACVHVRTCLPVCTVNTKLPRVSSVNSLRPGGYVPGLSLSVCVCVHVSTSVSVCEEDGEGGEGDIGPHSFGQCLARSPLSSVGLLCCPDLSVGEETGPTKPASPRIWSALRLPGRPWGSLHASGITVNPQGTDASQRRW